MKRQERIALGSKVLYFGHEYVITGFDKGGYTLEVPDKSKNNGYYKGVAREALTLLESNQPESPEVESEATWYTVVENIETTYKTDDYSGKRYPIDYSVFTVINGNSNQAIESFSAKEFGLDNAEYNANELKDNLNKALPKPAPQLIPVLAQKNAELDALRAANIKLGADLVAAQAIIVQAGDNVEKKSRSLLDALEANVQMRKENEVMKEVIAILADCDMISDALEALADDKNWEVWATLQHFKEEVLDKKSASLESLEAPQENPKAKHPVPARMRLKWNERGFSSGDYEVLGFSQEKKAYVLNISTDENKPMPHWVKMVNCLAK